MFTLSLVIEIFTADKVQLFSSLVCSLFHRSPLGVPSRSYVKFHVFMSYLLKTVSSMWPVKSHPVAVRQNIPPCLTPLKKRKVSSNFLTLHFTKSSLVDNGSCPLWLTSRPFPKGKIIIDAPSLLATKAHPHTQR